MLKVKIEGRNLTNGVVTEAEYPISEGAVFTENYNETLDSGTIIVQQLTAKIEIEPFDVAIIRSDGGEFSINERRMCVDTVTCTQTSLNPPIYSYQISLFSETKLLENILCPSLAITKRMAGTPLTILDYIDRYLELFSPYTDSSAQYGAYNPKYVRNYLKNWNKFRVPCPEMQWNQPTLREVLNDLMMTVDCIAVLRDNLLEYIDVSEEESEITDAQKASINYITESHSSTDYVSEIKTSMVNAISTESRPTEIVEDIGFRNDDAYLLTTEELRLQTTFPIWELVECTIVFDAKVTMYYNGHSTRTIDVDGITIDLTPYILEHGDWLSKNVFYGSWTGPSAPTALTTQYRNTCFYYTRGARNILNFNAKYQTSSYFIPETKFILELIYQLPEVHSYIEDHIQYVSPEDEFKVETPATTRYYGSIRFRVKYKSLSDGTFLASKSDHPRNLRQVMDNQANSYVNAERLGALEYMKANRLGNKMIHANARYACDEGDMPELAEKINGKVIFQKQISVYDKHIDANYQATENYVLRDYYTGVRAKLRSWRILSGSEALTRNEVVKFYVNSSIDSVSNANRVIPVYSDLDDYFDNFKYCVVYSVINDNDDIIPESTEHQGVIYQTNAIQVEFAKHKIGNSVLFTIRMNDNYYNGNYVSNYFGQYVDANSNTTYQIEQKGVRYADENGEVMEFVICFYDEIGEGFSDGWANLGLKPLVNAGTDPTADPPAGLSFSSDHLVAKIPVLVYKDNKETLQVSIQFEQNDEANDLFLGFK